MVAMNRTGILIIRAGVIILALFGISLLLVLSEPFLTGLIGGAIRAVACFSLFIYAWDFSKRIGEPGGWLNRAPKTGGHQANPTPDRMTNAASLKTQDIDESYFGQVAQEMKQDHRDEGLWTKAYALAQGDRSRRKSLYVEMRARKLFGEHETEVRRAQEDREAEVRFNHDVDVSNRKILRQLENRTHRQREKPLNPHFWRSRSQACIAWVIIIWFVLMPVLAATGISATDELLGAFFWLSLAGFFVIPFLIKAAQKPFTKELP